MPARKSAQLSAIIALGFAKLLTCLDFKVQIVFLMAGLGLPAKVSQGSLVCRRFGPPYYGKLTWAGGGLKEGVITLSVCTVRCMGGQNLQPVPHRP